MANSHQILAKIARNLVQEGIPSAQVAYDGVTVSVTKTGGNVLTVTYVAKAIQAPMGGIDPTVSPFLGIGVAAPGSLKIKGNSGETTIGAIFSTSEALQLLNEVSGYANDIVVESGSSTTQLARLHGHSDLLGMGA